MKYKIHYICLIVVLAVLCISVCEGSKINKRENLQVTSTQKVAKAEKNNSYISITYGRDNPDNFTEREMVFYTYDIESEKLEEKCVLPYDSQFACGVFSKKNNKVYYSSRVKPNDISSNDGIWEYDVPTGKSTLLENQNWSYNSITMMGTDKLFVMASTKDHPILPAYFDLKTKKFTYMSEANGEEIGLYSCGPVDAQYNSATDEIVCAYQNEAESYTTEFMHGEVAIDTYIAIASADMVKDTKRIYPMSLTVDDQVMSVTQISKNECLVGVNHFEGTDIEERLFTVTFNGNQSEAKRVEPPYPDSGEWKTIDGGKSYYFLLQKDGERGLYCYDTETRKLTEILTGNPDENGHVVSYTILDDK